MLDAPRNFIKNSPVTSLTTAESLTAGVLTFLVTHNVIGNVDVSTTTQTVAPFVALAVPAVFGAAKWSLVTPFARVKDLAERDGLVSDADFARLDALLDEKLAVFTGDADDADTADDGDFDVDTDVFTDDGESAGDDGGDQPSAEPADDLDVLSVEPNHHAEHRAAESGVEPASLQPDAPGGMAAGETN